MAAIKFTPPTVAKFSKLAARLIPADRVARVADRGMADAASLDRLLWFGGA